MLPPLKFCPIYQDYVWGPLRQESRIAQVFGRELPLELERVAESWELVDLPPAWVSHLREPVAGAATLRDLLVRKTAEVLGPDWPAQKFPIMVKFLDIEDRLSVQVHPDDETAARLGADQSGKDEAWVILAAGLSARIWAGFREGVSRSDVEAAIRDKRLAELLWETVPRPGECYHFPPGTVHAAGGGLLVAEIQQASNVTFRLYDWDRRTAEGVSRPLHVQEGLLSLRLPQGPVNPVRPVALPGSDGVELLVQSAKFTLLRRKIEGSTTVGVGNSCRVIIVAEGALSLSTELGPINAEAGDVILIPWCLREVELRRTSPTEAIILEVAPQPPQS